MSLCDSVVKALDARVHTWLLSSFFCVVIRDRLYGMSANHEADLLIRFRYEAYPCGRALPARRCAFGLGPVVAGGFAQGLFQNRLTAAQLHHDRRELPPIVRNTAIGNVVAVPTG